jgi:import receptor subunit TOM22
MAPPLTLSYAAKRVFASFKKASWIAATTTLILLVPLIIEMDREAQITEMEKNEMSVLTKAA